MRHRRWQQSSQGDRGSAALVAVAMMAVLLAVTMGGLCIGAAVIARHRAQTAADLASLAAAGRLANGADAACAQASAVARAMNTAVTQCVVDQLDVTVTVDVPVALGRIGIGTARAAARAGPGDAEALLRLARRSAAAGAALAQGVAELAAQSRRDAAGAAGAAAERVSVLIVRPLGVCYLPAFLCLGIVPVGPGLAGDVLLSTFCDGE